MTKRFVLLITNDMRPVPNNIRVEHTLGRETCIDQQGDKLCVGDACVVAGEPDAFLKWLWPLNGVWSLENPSNRDWRYFELPQIELDQEQTAA